MRFKDATLLNDGGYTHEADVGRRIRLHHIPAWLTKRLREEGFIRGRADDAADVMRQQWEGWLDHYGSYKDGRGRHVFVSEPYPFGIETLKTLVDFCERLRLDCILKANSYHYPTGCLRIELLPADEGGMEF